MRKFFNTFRLPLLWFATFALMLAVMLPGLKGGFFFDDTPNIVENKAIHIQTLDIASLRGSVSGPEAGPLGRPVAVLSFALTHYFFGLDPFAFKAINLGIHAINGLLVAWLVSLLLRNSRSTNLTQGTISVFSIWVAATWLVHPINVVPVMLAVQRMTLLSGMFMLLALISHLKAMAATDDSRSHWVWLVAGWLLFWPLSILSKETGLLFPLYVLAITLLTNPEKASRPGKKSWVVIVSISFLLMIAALMLSYLGWYWLENAYSTRFFTLSERLMTEARVLWFYTAQIALPNLAAFGLYHDDIRISTSLFTPITTLLSIIGWCAVILGIWILRKPYAFLCFAISWFLLGQSLESTFLPLEIAHEYRNYMPSIGLIAGLGYLGLTTLQNSKLNQRSSVIMFAAIIPVLVLAFFTWTRTEQLGQPLVGPQIEAARHPQSARAQHAAGLVLIKAGYGDHNDASSGEKIRTYLQQSIAVDSTFKIGYHSLIVWACASERPVEAHWIDGFSDRLAHTPFGPKEQELPDHLIKLMINLPKCLSQQDAIRLLEAGASNPKISTTLRTRFLEAAADYELLIARNIHSARQYLIKASGTSPHDLALRQKLNSLTFTKASQNKPLADQP